MRRALLVAAAGVLAIVVPAIVLAVTAPSGAVLDTTNYNTTYQVSYLNKAQCAGTDNLHLQWNIVALSGATFAQNDQYRIFASNTKPVTDSTTGGVFCAEKPDSTGGVIAGAVGSPILYSTALQSQDESGVTAATAATGAQCGTANEGTVIYICSHWYDAAGTTRKGYAWGSFQVQVDAPPDPTGLSTPQPGSSSLQLSWSANPTTGTITDHYVAEAFLQGTAPAAGTVPPFANAPVATATTTGTSATISGLDNSTTYDVIVVAYSLGGNPSGASASVTGTPVPTAGFWDVYKSSGGVEEGGCATGSAGALAMLGAAALLAVRRRRS